MSMDSRVLRALAISGWTRRVRLGASVDERSKFGDTVVVVDELRKAGIERICFLTDNSARR
jgi:biopolymer transport protein ExbD